MFRYQNLAFNEADSMAVVSCRMAVSFMRYGRSYLYTYIVFTSTLVETQHDARIDSDPILAFPCVAFLHLVIKNPRLFLVINLCISRINITQDLASLCEPALESSFTRLSCGEGFKSSPHDR